MRPTVIANANSSTASGPGGGAASANANSNSVNIPINQDYVGHHPAQQPQQQQQAYYVDPSNAAFGSPNARSNQPHFQQGFGFEPDMDMDMDVDMFPRSRLGRMHDPFAGFGGSHFGMPQFGSMGRRRVNTDSDDDFFNRLPSEFRQYIPEGFGHRRAGSGHQPGHSQYYQNYVPAGTTPPNGVPQSPSKTVCDAAIQTEEPEGRSEVDNANSAENLKQHGLRNTVDMGVKSAVEGDAHGPRAQSAPPHELLQQQKQQSQQAHQAQPQQQQQYQQMPLNGKRATPPPQAGFSQFAGTQTSPHVQPGMNPQSSFHKAYYAPQQQPHPQQRPQSQSQASPPPPTTPGGSNVRTIPIFVEGRSEPIINSHKEIPNQSSASASARTYVPHAQQQQPQSQQQQYYSQPQHQPQAQQPPHQHHQQQHRPTPLNTQQASQQQPQFQAQEQGQPQATGLPPQTPHTLDSINKIQDIQRDVLDLMGKVENFKGTRRDKEYVYLDEMLTRNLLKLDTIDTNGKESIRMARKEAIKCIQASINVLEAKAEENAKAAARQESGPESAQPMDDSSEKVTEQTEKATAEKVPTPKSSSTEKVTKEAVESAAAAMAEASTASAEVTQTSSDSKIKEAIPLPPPEGMQVDETQTQASTDDSPTKAREATPEKRTKADAAGAEADHNATTETKTEESKSSTTVESK